ncbi:MAG TPA: methyltransferase domain-containing protein [Anaerolineales bacterium]|nr:methyltransferase domain-containing protein [Anaerolineales bacterium]
MAPQKLLIDTRVNYDTVAPTYNGRYARKGLEGISSALRALAQNVRPERILEVGCGTGHWLEQLSPLAHHVHGLDFSSGMLRQARQRSEPFHLTHGRANRLPFANASFDLVFCVNAFHHFDQPAVVIAEARRLLKPGGAFAIIGMDPHVPIRWYLYDYFPGTRETDLGRFPSGGTVLDWMIAAGFENAEWRLVHQVAHDVRGRDALADHFLQKNGTSQLTLLGDEAYTAGLRRIEADLAEAEAKGETLTFPVYISFSMVTAQTSQVLINL